ncbi:hypothetical protein BH18ACT5_BH18ACT5_08470 [soil metagenome]
MAKKIEEDSVTVKGLPGKPENVGESISARGEELASKGSRDEHQAAEHDAAGAVIPDKETKRSTAKKSVE